LATASAPDPKDLRTSRSSIIGFGADMNQA
jgi:hypothetical protein